MVLVLDLGDGWLLDAQQSSSGLYNIDGAEQSGADSDATTGPAPDRVVLIGQSDVTLWNGDPWASDATGQSSSCPHLELKLQCCQAKSGQFWL